MKKNPCQKKKVCINYFDEQEKPWRYLKIFQKKNKNFKATGVVLGYLKPKFSSSANHGGRHFSKDLAPQPFYCCYGPKCAGKDENASGFSKYFNLSRRETALVLTFIKGVFHRLDRTNMDSFI